MIPLQKLKNEDLIPAIQPNAGVVAFSGNFVNWWDGIAAEDITLNSRKIFSAEDFKETVRRERQILQDYFVKKVPSCQRVRFQFQSPKDTVEHAYWLTICRVYYGEINYKERITATQKAFDALKP